MKMLAEFTQRPPAFDPMESPSDESVTQEWQESSEPEGFGRIARLTWQLHSDAALLMERTADLLVEAASATKQPDLVSAVRLLPLDRTRRRPSMYPWKVAVSTNSPTKVADILRKHQDWLGIGVDVDDDVDVRLLGRCMAGYGGLEGLVGGLVQSSQETYALTCNHVVVDRCQSVARQLPVPSPAVTGIVNSAPDLVLLNPETPCFRAPSVSSSAVLVAPSASAIEALIARRTAVWLTHPECPSAAGVVKAAVSLVRIGEVLQRFPLLEVIPRLNAYVFGLLKYPFHRTFAREGYSGAWVADTATQTWVGMVAGGDDRGSTYLLDAAALADYLSLLCGWPNRAPIVTATWPVKNW